MNTNTQNQYCFPNELTDSLATTFNDDPVFSCLEMASQLVYIKLFLLAYKINVYGDLIFGNRPLTSEEIMVAIRWEYYENDLKKELLFDECLEDLVLEGYLECVPDCGEEPKQYRVTKLYKHFGEQATRTIPVSE